MFRVTKTNPEVFDDEKFSGHYRCFFTKPYETPEEEKIRFNELKKKCKKRFRVCDDDGIWYFQGFSTTDSTYHAFDPLDYLGVDYGATYIEYWNAETKRWEEL